MKNGDVVRRGSWSDGKLIECDRGRFYTVCPERGRELHNGHFPIEDIFATDWS